MRGWPVREQWKSQGKMERQFNVKDSYWLKRKTTKLRSKLLGMTVRFLLSSSLLSHAWRERAGSYRGEWGRSQPFFLKQGENQKRQKTIIVIGPGEGNTAKTRGMTEMLNLPLLQVFFRSARQSRNYHHIVVFKRRKSFTLPANKRNKRSRCF